MVNLFKLFCDKIKFVLIFLESELRRSVEVLFCGQWGRAYESGEAKQPNYGERTFAITGREISARIGE